MARRGGTQGNRGARRVPEGDDATGSGRTPWRGPGTPAFPPPPRGPPSDTEQDANPASLVPPGTPVCSASTSWSPGSGGRRPAAATQRRSGQRERGVQAVTRGAPDSSPSPPREGSQASSV